LKFLEQGSIPVQVEVSEVALAAELNLLDAPSTKFTGHLNFSCAIGHFGR
jgi:hypothetical protein